MKNETVVDDRNFELTHGDKGGIIKIGKNIIYRGKLFKSEPHDKNGEMVILKNADSAKLEERKSGRKLGKFSVLFREFAEMIKGGFSEKGSLVDEENIQNFEEYYRGEFQNGQYNGKGRIEYANGREWYEGGFKYGVYHGKGVFCGNDMEYSGMWEDGQIHGKGDLTIKNVRYKGLFKRSKFIRGEKHVYGKKLYQGEFFNRTLVEGFEVRKGMFGRKGKRRRIVGELILPSKSKDNSELFEFYDSESEEYVKNPNKEKKKEIEKKYSNFQYFEPKIKKIRMAMSLEHENFTKVYGYVSYKTRDGKLLKCVAARVKSEFKFKEDLDLKPSEKFLYLSQIVDAMDYLHNEMGYLHLDLHWGNCRKSRDKKRIFINAFKTISARSKKAREVIGTEIYSKYQVGGKEEVMDESCDIWSFGLMIFEVMQCRLKESKRDKVVKFLDVHEEHFKTWSFVEKNKEDDGKEKKEEIKELRNWIVDLFKDCIQNKISDFKSIKEIFEEMKKEYKFKFEKDEESDEDAQFGVRKSRFSLKVECSSRCCYTYCVLLFFVLLVLISVSFLRGGEKLFGRLWEGVVEKILELLMNRDRNV